METSDVAPSYAIAIRPLFRQKDISSMRNFGGFDLGSHADVSEHAESIYQRLKDRSMPCDGAWSQSNIELFKSWIEAGKLP